jgi:tRNA A-37 threonylcarbamoyl transferase component Bud32
MYTEEPSAIQSHSHAAAAHATLELREALRRLRRRAESVIEQHRAGRLHLQAAEWPNDEGQQPPAAHGRRFEMGFADPEICPPALAEQTPLFVPVERNAARALFQQRSIGIAPEQIDFYQLGTLLYRWLTGRPIQTYLYDPRAKRAVPLTAVGLLDRLLGFRAEVRFGGGDQVLAAIDQLLEEIPADEPPPFGHVGGVRLVRQIGRGGMAEIFEGVDEQGRVVAVKVLRSDRADDQELQRRFREEATAVQRLSHPNIVPVWQVGDDGGRSYFVMPRIEGVSLDKRLRDRGALPIDETLDIVRQTLQALACAHAAGCVHRDVKPGNLLVEEASGRVVLADFGLVRRFQETSYTTPGLVMGTLQYLAPEQARGQPVDPRTDLYAVGVLLYEMLAGSPPFSGETDESLALQHAFHEPTPLGEKVPETPRAVQDFVERLMQKQPDDRYASADEALSALQAILTGDWPPATRHVPPCLRRRRRRAFLAAVAATVGAALVAAGFFHWLSVPPVYPGLATIEAATLRPGQALPHQRWVHLLGVVAPEWDAVSGDWRREGTSLITGDQFYSRVVAPVRIDGSYDLVVDFTRQASTGSVNIILPVGERMCCLYLAGWEQQVHGIGIIHGLSPRDLSSPAAFRPGQLIEGVRYRVRVAVRVAQEQASIEVLLDGTPLVSWEGRTDALSLQAPLRIPESHRLAFGGVFAEIRYHGVWLCMRSGQATMAARPAPPVFDRSDKSWCDLLAAVDRDAQDPSASDVGQDRRLHLVPRPDQTPHVVTAHRPLDGNYDLWAEFERHEGTGAVAFILPTAHAAVGLRFSAAGGSYGGLERVDGLPLIDNRNPAGRQPNQISNGQPHQVFVRVRSDDGEAMLDVWLDDRPMLRWRGPADHLAVDPAWAGSLPDCPAVGIDASATTFYGVYVRPNGEDFPAPD